MVFKKDTNKMLLYLIIIHLVLFTAFSIYYQFSLKSISKESDLNKNKVDQITTDMVMQQLNETIRLRDIAQRDRQAFEKRYYDLYNENTQLRKENKVLRDENKALKDENDNINFQLDYIKRTYGGIIS